MRIDVYIDRFNHPLWNELLQLAHKFSGGAFPPNQMMHAAGFSHMAKIVSYPPPSLLPRPVFLDMWSFSRDKTDCSLLLQKACRAPWTYWGAHIVQTQLQTNPEIRNLPSFAKNSELRDKLYEEGCLFGARFMYWALSKMHSAHREGQHVLDEVCFYPDKPKPPPLP